MRLIMLICASAVLLAGCINHDNDYLKQGGQISSLVVPAGVPALKQEPFYPIPANTSDMPAKPVSLKPATLTE
ncbi:MAG: hypothetical protein Q8L78_02995 [Coxiellaceae bacterium]|nr:hypothetical protein [Coxiellaceae bacterium]